MKYLKFAPFYVLSLVPIRLLYLISDVLYFLMYVVAGYRKKVVAENLKIAFPNKTALERTLIERAFFRQFTRVFAEVAKNLTISDKKIRRLVRVTNPEVLKKELDKGNSVFLNGAHIGNWEYLISLPTVIGLPTSMFFQTLSLTYYNKLLYEIRTSFGATYLDSLTGYQELLALDRSGKKAVHILLSDQSPRKESRKHWTDFFGQETAFLTGVERLANELNYAVYYPYTRKVKGGTYEITFRKLGDPSEGLLPGELIDRYAAVLEENIKDQPELWLWTHRRWKLNRADFPDVS